MRHLDIMAKVMLATGLIVAYGYDGSFMAFYSGNQYDKLLDDESHAGPYAVVYWSLDRLQHADSASAVVASACGRFVHPVFDFAGRELGMWLERFVIVVISLNRDFVPSSGGCISRRAGTG